MYDPILPYVSSQIWTHQISKLSHLLVLIGVGIEVRFHKNWQQNNDSLMVPQVSLPGPACWDGSLRFSDDGGREVEESRGLPVVVGQEPLGPDQAKDPIK